MKLGVTKMIELLSFSFPLISLMFSFLSVSDADSNVYVQCSQLNYSSMSHYELNVNSLFTSLVDSATVSNFNKFETSQSDVIYGLFQCQSDLRSSSCKDCVTNAVNQLKTTCRVSTSGTIQLEQCFVKYDNNSFFGVEDKMEVLKRCGPSIGYNSDVLNHIDEAMVYLVTGNGQYFHGGDFGSIQGFAQCVQDLSLSDCQDCLSEASGRLRSECESSTWGEMYLGKCYIRYFDQGDFGHTSGYNNSDDHRDDGINSKTVIKIISYIVAVAAGGGVTFVITVSIKNRNKYANKEQPPKKTIDKAKKQASEKENEAIINVIHQIDRPVQFSYDVR